jgi:hypothetical protein
MNWFARMFITIRDDKSSIGTVPRSLDKTGLLLYKKVISFSTQSSNEPDTGDVLLPIDLKWLMFKMWNHWTPLTAALIQPFLYKIDTTEIQQRCSNPLCIIYTYIHPFTCENNFATVARKKYLTICKDKSTVTVRYNNYRYFWILQTLFYDPYM